MISEISSGYNNAIHRNTTVQKGVQRDILIKEIKKLHKKGVARINIRQQLNCSYYLIDRTLQLKKELKADNAPINSIKNLSQTQIDEIKELMEKRWLNSEIIKKTNITFNVIRKILIANPYLSETRIALGNNTASKILSAKKTAIIKTEGGKEYPFQIKEKGNHLSIIELERTSCCFPSQCNDGKTYYCGAIKFKSLSYCEDHCKIMYGQAWQRVLANLAKKERQANV